MTAGAVCREGHLSDEPDYCSVCGAPILSGSAVPAVALPGPPPRSVGSSGGASGSCPSCGEPREDPNGRFCEVCRYDFQERRPGPPPVVKSGAAPKAPPVSVPTPAPAPAAATPVLLSVASVPLAPATPVPTASASPSRASWELVIKVDASLDTEPDPDSPCPKDRADIVMAVDKPDMLVGRHDDTRAIHPEVSLHDPGASRRHARFVIEPDGAIALQDLASTNGTEVNAAAVPPGTRRRLVDGDSVTLGRWTRITVRART